MHFEHFRVFDFLTFEISKTQNLKFHILLSKKLFRPRFLFFYKQNKSLHLIFNSNFMQTDHFLYFSKVARWRQEAQEEGLHQAQEGPPTPQEGTF